VLDGVYWRTDGEPVFVAVPAPTDDELQALLHRIITRLMKMLTRRGVLVEEEGGDRATWPMSTPIRMRPARSGRCRRRRVPTALPSARAPARRFSRCKVRWRETLGATRICVPTIRASAYMRRYAAMPTSASGWNSCAGPSPDPHWPTNGYRSTPPGSWP